MHEVTNCDRCESKIVQRPHLDERPADFKRYAESGEIETDHARLCSMCLDDLWEFVFEVDIDRSDKADPIPVDRVVKHLDRDIDHLEGLISDLNGTKPEGSQ